MVEGLLPLVKLESFGNFGSEVFPALVDVVLDNLEQMLETLLRNFFLNIVLKIEGPYAFVVEEELLS